MHEVIMPKLGLTMETGVIEKWHKKEGDKVEAGEVLFEVMTDKVSLEVEAYHSGILKKILRNEGEEVPVTEVIAYIGEPDEQIPEVQADKSSKASQTVETGQVVQTQEQITQTIKTTQDISLTQEKQEAEKLEEIKEIKISPLARNLAKAKGIDITKIKGTGPQGRIVREDVEKYIESMQAEAVGAVSAKVEVSQPGELKEISVTEKALTESDMFERIKISPLARNLAKELGIDYTKEPIKGTGPQGRIVKEDILAYAETKKSMAAQAAQAAQAQQAQQVKQAQQVQQAQHAQFKPSVSPETIPMAPPKIKSSVPLKGMRKVIAERLTYSKQNIPHIIPTAIMDVTSLILLREKIKDKVQSMYGVKLTYTDFIIKASAITLSEYPVINASLQDGNHIIYEDVNVGVAVSVEGGLIVPTIYSADKLSLFDIAKKRTELIEKAKASKLTIEEVSNGTFTISNLGMYGIRTFTAIINPPQGAILMVGEIYKAPVVIEDKIEIRSQMEISIAVDHRIIDGADAAKYLARLREIIENPELMLI